MPVANADTFKRTLQAIEQSGDPTALVALFAEEATVDAPARESKMKGPGQIKTFWTEYLAAFQKIRSTFHTEHAAGDTAVLEWTSAGTLPTGKPIQYRGVSIVTFKNDLVATFATYYDSAAFVTPSAVDTRKAAVPGHDTNNEGGD